MAVRISTITLFQAGGGSDPSRPPQGRKPHPEIVRNQQKHDYLYDTDLKYTK